MKRDARVSFFFRQARECIRAARLNPNAREAYLSLARKWRDLAKWTRKVNRR